jgi:Zn-dependent protease with chaperone function
VNARNDVEQLRDRGMLSDRDIAVAIETGRRRNSFISVNELFSTHPPVYKRLANLAEIQKELSKTRGK